MKNIIQYYKKDQWHNTNWGGESLDQTILIFKDVKEAIKGKNPLQLEGVRVVHVIEEWMNDKPKKNGTVKRKK